MTNTPEQYRALADNATETGEYSIEDRWIRSAQTALCTAADEVDQLRADLGTQNRVNADLKRASDAFLEERDRLRAVIENAPHGAECNVSLHEQYGETTVGVACTCWKADAL